jgi:hypothetical protein
LVTGKYWPALFALKFNWRYIHLCNKWRSVDHYQKPIDPRSLTLLYTNYSICA